MKKQLLLGSALLTVISAFPQGGRLKPGSTSAFNMAGRIASKYEMINNPVERVSPEKPVGPEAPTQLRSANSSAAASFVPISGSMNIYGMLVSNCKPLTWHPQLDVVSFVHRKSATYNPQPAQTTTGAISGAIVAQISKSIDGLLWDSTCIWNDANNWARYPQGGVYNPPGNTNVSNAYVIGVGPVTSAASSWVGSFLASKQLNTFDATASAAPNAQQFISNTSPFGPAGKVDFPRYDMAVSGSTIRTIGTTVNNVNGTGSAYGFRGANALQASFNSGTFTWSADTVIPSIAINSSDNTAQVIASPHMAWSEDGSVGYIWFIGCRAGRTRANSGYQPIVFKRTSSSSTWTELPPIDFNTNAFQKLVLDHLASVSGDSTLAIPFFNFGEGIDGIVDANGNLHIATTIMSTFSSHTDSLGFGVNFTNADGESYNYLHGTSGSGFSSRPYIYDFVSPPTTAPTGKWSCTLIDSMSTEAPAERSGRPGYGSNPWDAAGGTGGSDKVSSDARLQLSRSEDGKFIVFTWAESDTNLTTSGFKWNNIPNVKARAIMVTGGGSGQASIVSLSPDEINITNQAGANPLVANRAQMHYASPKFKVVTSTGSGSTTCVDVKVPVTVSNSNPLKQLQANTHYFASAAMNFCNFREFGVGINENTENSVNNSILFPNPAKNNAQLVIDMSNNSVAEIKVMNLIGDVIKTMNVNVTPGRNDIGIDLKGMSTGIYLVNIKVDNATTTKKLIIE